MGLLAVIFSLILVLFTRNSFSQPTGAKTYLVVDVPKTMGIMYYSLATSVPGTLRFEVQTVNADGATIICRNSTIEEGFTTPRSNAGLDSSELLYGDHDGLRIEGDNYFNKIYSYGNCSFRVGGNDTNIAFSGICTETVKNDLICGLFEKKRPSLVTISMEIINRYHLNVGDCSQEILVTDGMSWVEKQCNRTLDPLCISFFESEPVSNSFYFGNCILALCWGTEYSEALEQVEEWAVAITKALESVMEAMTTLFLNAAEAAQIWSYANDYNMMTSRMYTSNIDSKQTLANILTVAAMRGENPEQCIEYFSYLQVPPSFLTLETGGHYFNQTEKQLNKTQDEIDAVEKELSEIEWGEGAVTGIIMGGSVITFIGCLFACVKYSNYVDNYQPIPPLNALIWTGLISGFSVFAAAVTLFLIYLFD